MGAIRDRIAQKSKPNDVREQTTLCGEAVEVRRMSVGQRSRVMEVGYVRKGKDVTVRYDRFYPALLAATVVEPGSDSPVFEYPKDADVVNGLDPEEVDRVAEIALRLSGLDKEAPKRAEGHSEEASDD